MTFAPVRLASPAAAAAATSRSVSSGGQAQFRLRTTKFVRMFGLLLSFRGLISTTTGFLVVSAGAFCPCEGITLQNKSVVPPWCCAACGKFARISPARSAVH